jgi:hypothetical protein
MAPRTKLACFAAGLPLAAAAVGLVGVVRLTRQFPAAAASPGLLTPFLLPVLALALETGALIALSAALLRVLSSAPAQAEPSSVATRARGSFALVSLAALVLALAQLIPRGTERPGAFANQLVESARSSCGGARQVPVPLLGLSVRCTTPQRIEGPMPGARKARLAMNGLVFSDDLRRVEISALELTLPGTPPVRLRADHARVSGFSPWSRSPRLSVLARLLLLTGLGVALWLGASLLVRPDPRNEPRVEPSVSARLGRAAVYLLFALPGALASGAVISLDQAQAAPLAYSAAGGLGLAALALVAWVLRRAPQIAGYFRTF